MQSVTPRAKLPESGGQHLDLTDLHGLTAGHPVAGLKRQTTLAPHMVQLTFRQRGVDSSPVDIHYGTGRSWLGDYLLAWTMHGICWLELRPGAESLLKLQRSWRPDRLIPDAPGAARYARDIFGAARSSVPLHLSGTAFQLQVWSVLLRIRPGHYLTYGDVAREIGLPRAARAVGQAVGSNNAALLVPCHRVLSEGGRLGGYRWGPDLKFALLQRETLCANSLAD